MLIYSPLRAPQFSEHMDPSIQWNVAYCNLIPPGAPFIAPGMSSICPLKTVTLFVLQLTRRGTNNPSAPSIYLALSYDMGQNTLHVHIPPKLEQTTANSMPHLTGIANHLKRFCEQFRSTGSQACVIYPAIRQLLSIPNLLSLPPMM